MTHKPRHSNRIEMSPSSYETEQSLVINGKSNSKPTKRAMIKRDKRNSTTNQELENVESSNEDEMLGEDWISATSTYNYMMKDPLLDWLKYHHGSFVHKHRKYRDVVNKCLEFSEFRLGYSKATSHRLEDNKSTYNFTSYIMEQGHEFERKVMKMITKKFAPERVAEIHGELDPRNPAKVQETLDAMKQGIPIIHSGVLHNHKNRTFGIPDLLVRSDWVKFLIDESPISAEDEIISALNLGVNWHYRVIDIKFTGLLLRANATHLLNAASFPAYKAQLLIYNWALGQLQGYTPNQVYILGRRWKYTAKGETYTGNACFDKLAIIDYYLQDREYVSQTEKALEWLREVRSEEAADWNILDYPLDRWELYPNMCNAHDHPWHAIKEEIADQTKELTALWMVGPKNRNLALEEEIYQWTDKDCTAENLGITGEKTSRVLNEIIKINQSSKKKISPKYVVNNIGAWKHIDTIEFFVDFETCNGAVSSIKRLPAAQNETLVFMIGVGYIDPDDGKWIYRDFTVERLTFAEEARICKEFADFIRDKSKQHGVKHPKCIHWARAEDIMWSDAVERHNPVSDEWKSWMWNWLDLLLVFKEEPIVINGCMSFGLKDVASAMKKHGFIKTSWNKKSICVDGQSAMIAARKAHVAARESGVSMKRIPIMKQIIKYNEVDVRVLYEIITYLRKYHTLELSPLYNKNKRHHDELGIFYSKENTSKINTSKSNKTPKSNNISKSNKKARLDKETFTSPKSTKESSKTKSNKRQKIQGSKKTQNIEEYISDEESDQESDQESDRESDQESDKESDRESDQESDKESDRESDQESDKESDKESDQESDQESDKESDQELDKEAISILSSMVEDNRASDSRYNLRKRKHRT